MDYGSRVRGPAYTDEEKAFLTTLSQEAYVPGYLVGDDRCLTDLYPARQLAELRLGQRFGDFTDCLRDADKRAAWIVELAGDTEPVSCFSCSHLQTDHVRGPFRNCRRARILVDGNLEWALKGNCANCHWAGRHEYCRRRRKGTTCSLMRRKFLPKFAPMAVIFVFIS